MKKLTLLFLAVFLTLYFSIAQADHYGYAVIDARTSDRVHLREQPSASSGSMGLYFTGTWVECLGSLYSEWTPVRIGSQSGYMMSRYLVHESASAVASRQPQALVTADGMVNLRALPSLQGDALRRLPAGTAVTLLGETADGWCYVRTQDHLCGYMAAAYLAEAAPADDGEADPAFSTLPSLWLLSSGAGAWETELSLFPDGSFQGVYHDSEMGLSDPAYPFGTVYHSSFRGQFAPPVRLGDTLWQTMVTGYSFDGLEGEEHIEDGVRYITTAGYGLAPGDVVTIYLPGTPADQLPEDFALWNHAYEGGPLESFSLYNLHTDICFEPW